MDYTREQLIDALHAEYDNMCHDSTLEEGELTPAQYLTYLNALSYDELVYETGDEEDLIGFMEQYGS